MPSPSSLPGLFARLDSFNEWVGKSLSWLILLMMLIEFLIVVLRYLFSVNSIAMQESVMYMHATLFMLAAAYTLRHDGHVRVDIFYRAMSARKKALVDLLGTLLLLVPVMLFVILTSLGYVGKSWRILEGSPETGGIPAIFLLKTLMPVFAVLMLVQGLVEAVRNALILSGRLPEREKDKPDDTHHEERL